MIVCRILAVPVLAAVAAALVACGGSDPVPAAPVAEAPAPPAATAPSGSGGSASCPLAATDLDSATGLTWTAATSMTDHPLETVEGVTADVCVFTSTDRPQLGGDPLVLRVDVVEGADAARMRDEFASTCTDNGGTVAATTSVAGGVVCRSRGQAIEGQVAGPGRTVDVYVVAADTATASELTPTFEKVLAVVG